MTEQINLADFRPNGRYMFVRLAGIKVTIVAENGAFKLASDDRLISAEAKEGLSNSSEAKAGFVRIINQMLSEDWHLHGAPVAMGSGSDDLCQVLVRN